MSEKIKSERKIRMVRAGESLRRYKEEQRRKRDRKMAVVISFVFIVTAISYAFWDRSFNSYVELTSTPNAESSYTQFAVYQDGHLKYSKDGISYLDGSGQIAWTEVYNMERPSISVEGDYAAVADLEGNEVQLYGPDGKKGSFSMPYSVKSVHVAAQGVFCVVLEGEDASYIRLYDSEGGILTDIKTQIENNGYPLAVAISSDGQKMAASFYCVDGINSKNVLSFYHFGEGGKGQGGNLVGTFQMEGTVVPKVEFMDHETVCAVGDDRTVFYRMRDKPKKIRQVLFDSEIKSVFSNGEYMGYVCENDAEDVEAGRKKPYQMMLYNKNGRLKESFGRDKLYEAVQIEGRNIICFTGSECSLTRANGTEFFCKNMGQNIVNLFPTSDGREFLVVYSDRSAKIRLKNVLAPRKEEDGGF